MKTLPCISINYAEQMCVRYPEFLSRHLKSLSCAKTAIIQFIFLVLTTLVAQIFMTTR